MKKLLLVCFFLLGISAASYAQGGGRQRQTPEQQTAALKESLKLTDDQAAKIKVILTQQGKVRDSLFQAANGDFSSIREKMMPLQTATATKVKAVLTKEQAEAYQKQMDERRARFQQGGGGGN
jgi:periplasmic protein CpxP/Spy